MDARSHIKNYVLVKRIEGTLFPLGREGRRMASELFLRIYSEHGQIKNTSQTLQSPLGKQIVVLPKASREKVEGNGKNTPYISSHQKNLAHEVSPSEKRN